MRVAIILDWFLYYATELANALSREHEVMLITRDHNFEVSSRDSPMSLDEYLRLCVSPTVRTELLRYRRGDPRGLTEVLRLNRLIDEWGADVLHIQDTSDWRISVLAALSRRRRSVALTIHDVETHPGDRRAMNSVMNRRLVTSAHGIVVHGDALRDQLRRRHPHWNGRVGVIPHGTFSLYRRWDDPSVAEEPGTVLFFGRISPYKGIETLIRAQPIVSTSVPGARFIIAGRGEDFSPYGRLIREHESFEIHNRFIATTEVAALFRRASVVVLPYREASQSGVVPIAYEFGKPVIVTRVGSLPEVVEHDVSGIVVDPGDAGQLAEAIISILADGERRGRLGAGARRMAESSLSWTKVAHDTAIFYGCLRQ